VTERQCGYHAHAGHAHQSPCRFAGLCFIADALVECGLLLLDLLLYRKQAIEDGPRRAANPLNPSFGAPLTSLNCTLTLRLSSIRIWPALVNNTHSRDPARTDQRFFDYWGSTDIVATNSGDNDSGMFEPNLND
jgi:Tc toxin complex TcA C-terminal TcB-binding domain